MEKLVDLGLVKSIGISNFNSEQVDRLLAKCRIKPVNNQVRNIFSVWNPVFLLKLVLFSLEQIEVSPQINQKKLINFCNERDIVITAYCPLGRPIPAEKKPGFLYDEKLGEIAEKYDKTIAQIVFRYLVCTNNCILISHFWNKSSDISFFLWFIRLKLAPFRFQNRSTKTESRKTSTYLTSISLKTTSNISTHSTQMNVSFTLRNRATTNTFRLASNFEKKETEPVNCT